MKKMMRKMEAWLQAGLAAVLCLALPALSNASISNTATATYSDAAAVNYNATSNTVSTLTPPVVATTSLPNGNLGVAYSATVTASENPTSFAATGLPTGLSINASGLISGTPTVSGTFSVSVTATNAAGTSAAKVLSLTILGAPNVVLTKSADRTTAAPGTIITYTITYQNTGAGVANNVVIRDVIPTGTTFVAGSITGAGNGTLANGTITWTIGSVSAGAAAQSVSFKVTVN